MRAKLHLSSAEFFIDFVFTKTQEIWPCAVLVDAQADPRRPSGRLLARGAYGCDVYRSDQDVENLFSGDCYPQPQALHVTYSDDSASISGPADLVRNIAQHPLWING